MSNNPVRKSHRSARGQVLFPSDYGAAANGTTDDTAAIQAAIDAGAANGAKVFIGGVNLVYRADTTIVVKRRVEVEIGAGVIVRRVVAAAATTPVFRLAGNEARLCGTGRIETEKASPDGVVLIGGPDLSTLANVLSAQLIGVVIAGVKAAGNIGIRIWSSFVASGGATYQNVVSGVTLDGFGTGVYASDVANANEFHGVELKNILDYAYDFYGNTAQRGADENAVLGGFLHASSGATGFRMRNVIYNQVYGFRMEPGGAGLPYNLDATSDFNHLFIIANMSGTGTNLGASNTVLVNGTLVGPIMRAASGTAAAPGVSFAADTSLGLFRQAAGVLSATTSGVEKWRLGTNLSMLTNLQINGNYVEFLERGTPTTPGADIVRLFARDSAGVTQLCFVDSAGTVKVLNTT